MPRLIVALFLLLLLPVSLQAEPSSHPRADDGQGRVYVFAQDADFAGSIAADAFDAYKARVRKDFPKAEIMTVSPFTKENLRKAIQELNKLKPTRLDIFVNTHGFQNKEKGTYEIQMQTPSGDNISVDGKILGEVEVPANFYLFTCHAGAAHTCQSLPKAKAIFFASPEHRTTRLSNIAQHFFYFAHSQEKLPDSPKEHWERIEQVQMDSYLENSKEFPSVSFQLPTGCVAGKEVFGGVCEKGFEDYRSLRVRDAARRRNISPSDIPLQHN